MAEVGGKEDAMAAAVTKAHELAMIASELEDAYLKERPYGCPLCDKRFLSRSHVREHQRVHTGERPFPCPACDRSFTTRHNLKRHQAIHAKEESYRCRRCGVLFCQVHKNPGDVGGPPSKAPSKGKQRGRPKKKKPVQAPSPSEWATRKQHKGAEPGVLTLHRNSASEIQRTPMAEVDGKADGKRAAAAAAVTKVREAALALIATRPDKSYKKDKAYQRDKADMKDRPYGCPLCDKRFLSRSHVREHQRVHTGERPFPCPHCDRSFTTRHNLKRHEAIHDKEESYRCRRCGVLFCHVHKNQGDVGGPPSKAPSKAKRKPKLTRGRPIKAARSPPPGPLSSSKPAFVATHPASKKKAVQSLSPPGQPVYAMQCNGAEPEVVTFRRNGIGLQNKIAYDIEVVL